MYCPKCSQEQPTAAMRYCSKCGFTLTGVARLIETNGALPQAEIVSKPTSRNRMMVESSVLMVIAWVITFIATFWFDYTGAFETVAKITALVFAVLGVIGLLRFVYAFLFVKDVALVTPETLNSRMSGDLLKERKAAELPEHQSVGISDYPIRTHTKEIVPRNSVTENTTKLLDN